MNDPISTMNPEEVERIVNESYKNIHKSVKFFSNTPGNGVHCSGHRAADVCSENAVNPLQFTLRCNVEVGFG